MWPAPDARPRLSERGLALKVAGVFLATGTTWVLLTDILLYEVTRDQVVIGRVETAKGWAFIFGTAALLYWVTLRSVTHVCKARATVAAVLESIADGVLIIGPERTIVYANPAASRLLRTPTSELVGLDAREFSRRFRVSHANGVFVLPDDYASLRAFDQRDPIQYRAVIYPPDAEPLPLDVTAAPVRVEDHPATLVVSVFHDVSESDRFDRLRDRLFASAAHSLKTPVAVIQGNAQLLSALAGKKATRATASILRQCGRIERLVENLLVVSRVRSGTLELHPTETELGPMVEEVVAEMAVASAQHRVLADVTASPRIHGDRERIAIALRGLIDSAFRSSDDGVPITVTVEDGDGEATIGVHYTSSDPGHAFDLPFDYDDMGASRHAAEAIVRAHGGELRKETAGAETTDWLILPTAA